jgi:hypothetical protein
MRCSPSCRPPACPHPAAPWTSPSGRRAPTPGGCRPSARGGRSPRTRPPCGSWRRPAPGRAIACSTCVPDRVARPPSSPRWRPRAGRVLGRRAASASGGARPRRQPLVRGSRGDRAGRQMRRTRRWRSDARFDRVLLDAPCTGLGTGRRRPGGPLATTSRDVTELAAAPTSAAARRGRARRAGRDPDLRGVHLDRCRDRRRRRRRVDRGPQGGLGLVAANAGDSCGPTLDATDGMYVATWSRPPG